MTEGDSEKMGFQWAEIDATLCIARDTEGVGRVNIRSMPGKYSKLSEGTMRYA